MFDQLIACRPVQVQFPAARPRLAGVHLQLLPGHEDAPAQEQARDHRPEQEAAQRQGANLQLGQGRCRGRALGVRSVDIWPTLIHPVTWAQYVS